MHPLADAQGASVARGSGGVLDAASNGGGLLLAATASVMALVRRPAKPLHPRGDVCRGTLHRDGGGDSGVPFLDTAGRDEVVVRRSRAAGLPRWLPDVHGLAIRVPVGDGHGDLLLATTGLGRVGRFVLTFARAPDSRPLTTLLPYRSPTGPLLLAAEALGPYRYRLSWAHGTGPWLVFGHLVVEAGHGDGEITFDPVVNHLPGLAPYGWAALLREPAYRAARRGRSTTLTAVPAQPRV